MGGSLGWSEASHCVCWFWGLLAGALVQAQVSPCLCLAWCHLVGITNDLLLVAACARFGGTWVRLCSELRLGATSASLVAARHVVQGSVLIIWGLKIFYLF